MTLDDLNRSVTAAILRAEALPAGSPDSQVAFLQVADLEEEIATIVGVRTAEGEIARLGAVQAALSGGDPLRALRLGERYRTDGLSDRAQAKLLDLLKEADADIDRRVAATPNIDPLRFTILAA
jgi:hypothetical protein